MSGGFSEHLINSFEQATQIRAPFGQPMNPNLSIHGAMSFNPQMHGSFTSQPPLSMMNEASLYMDLSQSSAQKIAELQAKLDMKLGPEFISQRPGPGGGPKLTYAEGWKIINLANEVFGFNGWSSNVVSLTTDFIDFSEESRRYTVGVTAIVRVTLRDGAFHEDIGYGMLENSKSKGAALDKCKKEAVTDAIKRALRNFGNLLGNCLYDKSYAQEVVKIKVPPAKFDKSGLYRRPEFAEPGSRASHMSASNSTPASGPANNAASSSKSTVTTTPIKTEPASSNMGPPRTTATSSSSHGTSVNRNPTVTNFNSKGKAPEQSGPSRRLEEINNSLKQQPAVPQTNPPPQQARDERRVSFAPSTSTEAPMRAPESADDSFTWPSDDDAFLAAVDLGPSDSGIGGPVDFDEGCSGIMLSGASGINDSSSELQTNRPQHSATARSPDIPRRGGPSGAGQAKASGLHQATGQDHLTGQSIPQQQPQRMNGPQTESSSSRAPVNGAGQRPSLARSTNAAVRAAMQQDQIQASTGPRQADTSTHNSAPSASGRPSIPSAGGFQFPPGMKPLTDGRPPQAQIPDHQRQPGQSGPMVGTKRPAEAMGPLSGSGRRPVQGPGMGLAQQQPTSGRREPFADLEFGEGGDVKRMRR